ncbi:hypothetical protein SELMODRAFT_131400 [Selaginella moellendorffii]|uniref:Tafazzin family protein n=2 Tax=Selaginella moellendorffii TaxID=88036 RepID=D8T3Y8_SELML|nr:hypothetical protein SELMODRAFT_131400 [Selaginella moellendorffii]
MKLHRGSWKSWPPEENSSKVSGNFLYTVHLDLIFWTGRGAATIDDDLKKKISEDSPTVRVLRAIAVPVLANVCHVFMHGLNHTEVYGLEKLEKALLHRPQSTGLLTLSNHVAAMDDPLVTASLLSPQILLHERMLRWTLCATDRCFTSVPKSIFFTSLKVLPVSRGKGIYQEGMDLALEKLNHGDWVHIFPEGSRSRDGGKTLGNVKRGVGRLVMDAKETPVIIPFMHEGMQEVLPIGSKFPHICKKVTVLVGDPILVDDLLARCKDQELTTDALYDAVAQRVEERMRAMKGELQQLVTNERLARERDRKLYLARRASGIWEHIDWEMEGFSLHSDDETIDHSQHQQQREFSEISSEDAAKTSWMDHPIHSSDRALDSSPSIAARLRAFGDPAAMVSFAARGIAWNWKMPEFKYGVGTWTARLCGNQGLGL